MERIKKYMDGLEIIIKILRFLGKILHDHQLTYFHIIICSEFLS